MSYSFVHLLKQLASSHGSVRENHLLHAIVGFKGSANMGFHALPSWEAGIRLELVHLGHKNNDVVISLLLEDLGDFVEVSSHIVADSGIVFQCDKDATQGFTCKAMAQDEAMRIGILFAVATWPIIKHHGEVIVIDPPADKLASAGIICDVSGTICITDLVENRGFSCPHFSNHDRSGLS